MFRELCIAPLINQSNTYFSASTFAPFFPLLFFLFSAGLGINRGGPGAPFARLIELKIKSVYAAYTLLDGQYLKSGVW